MRITLPVSLVLETVKKNRADHETIYTNAVKTYNTKLELRQKDIYNEINQHQETAPDKLFQPKPRKYMPVPEEHLGEYDRAIAMLQEVEHQVGDAATVDLDEHDYARFIQDNWEWRQRFVTNTASYAGG